jgi:lysophospholipase L1-like esterase
LKGLSKRLSRAVWLATGTLAGYPALGQTTAPVPDARLLDFADLAHYSAANAALPAPGPVRRVVFMGDSITESWATVNPEFFKHPGFIDRGISGQTTPQMLVRFRQDVIALEPAVVHILAGTNDIAGNTGPMELSTTEANIASMVDLARAHGIRVVLASTLPAADFPWRPGLEPGPKIVALNAWLAHYAQKARITYVDYYSALSDGALGIRGSLATDGVHPSLEGYRVMEPLAEAAIREAQRLPAPKSYLKDAPGMRTDAAPRARPAPRGATP